MKILLLTATFLTALYACKSGLTDGEFDAICASFLLLTFCWFIITKNFIAEVLFAILSIFFNVLDLLAHVYLQQFDNPIEARDETRNKRI